MRTNHHMLCMAVEATEVSCDPGMPQISVLCSLVTLPGVLVSNRLRARHVPLFGAHAWQILEWQRRVSLLTSWWASWRMSCPSDR